LVRGSDPGRDRRIFFSPEPFRSAVGPTQPHIHWVPVLFFVGVQRPWREVATHPNLVPMFRMTGAILVPFLHPRVETYQLIPNYHQ
jgi:hypothetical protein